VKRRSPRVTIGALHGAPILAAAALAGAVGLSGCQVMSPIQTDVPYQSADGVSVDLGDVQIRDLVVIAAAKGAVGTLSGLVLNQGAEQVTVTFSTDPAASATGDTAHADIPAGAAVRLSGVDGATPVTLPRVATAPGGIIGVTVSTPAAGAPVVSVPVLLPTGYYSTITPPPVPTTIPEPVPTTTPTPAKSTTPTPAKSTSPTPAKSTSP
jgi:hypothetical protein